jgi:hypothetical protein
MYNELIFRPGNHEDNVDGAGVPDGGGGDAHLHYHGSRCDPYNTVIDYGTVAHCR